MCLAILCYAYCHQTWLTAFVPHSVRSLPREAKLPPVALSPGASVPARLAGREDSPVMVAIPRSRATILIVALS